MIDEFSRIEQIKGQRARNVLTAAKPRRQTVAVALADCPLGEWISLNDLFTAMRRGGLSPTIARSERALWKLYLEDSYYGSLGYDGHHDWTLLEGRYTLAVLFEYAGTLGLIDLDYVHPKGARDDFRGNWGGDFLDALSRYDGLRAIRLNPLGAYALGLTDTYQPRERPGRCAVVEGAAQPRHRRHRQCRYRGPAHLVGLREAIRRPCVDGVGEQPAHCDRCWP